MRSCNARFSPLAKVIKDFVFPISELITEVEDFKAYELSVLSRPRKMGILLPILRRK